MCSSTAKANGQHCLKFKTVELSTDTQKQLSPNVLTLFSQISFSEPLYEIKACSHPTIMNDMCAECGADLRIELIQKTTASVPMIHAIPDLKVSEEVTIIVEALAVRVY